MSTETHNPQSRHVIHMPAPTPWPIVLALGITFLCAGLVTYWVISAFGFALMVRSAVGWFQDVVPHEKHDEIPVVTEAVQIQSTREQVAKLPVSPEHRTILPVKRYTVSAGVQGGIAGGIAMIIPATIFGFLRYHSIWYAPNLLASIALPGWSEKSLQFLTSFHADGFLVAVGVHMLASVLVGLLYGAVLPMFPKNPIFTAGFVAPIFWTGLLYAGLEAANPFLSDRIDWPWFIASQVAFGLMAGFVVNLHVKVRTEQYQARPFYQRAGLVSGRLEHEHDSEDRPQ